MIRARWLLALLIGNQAGTATSGKAITGMQACPQKCVSDDWFPGGTEFFSAMPGFPRARIAT